MPCRPWATPNLAGTWSSPVTARFADGTPLTIIGGPRQADGLTWWQVESRELAIGGWSAERFRHAAEP